MGTEAAEKLMNAHEDILIEGVSTAKEFSELALEADGVMKFGYKIPIAALQVD